MNQQISLMTSSEMTQRIRDFDWTNSELGAMDDWSAAFKTALELCLGSRMCSCIYWGREHRVIYNDAYTSILGTKHPWALGRPAREVWSEIYDIIGPLLQRTTEFGETTGADDAAIFINRSGYVEEFYCSFSYSPLVNQRGDIEAVFATIPETSERVIGERRLRTLQKLGVDSRGLSDPQQVLDCARRVFSENPKDLPFAAIYSWESTEDSATLFSTVNIDRPNGFIPSQIALRDPANDFDRAMVKALSEKYALFDIQHTNRELPTGAWQIPPTQLMMLPFRPPSEHAPLAALVVAINPHKRLDRAHVSFFQMLGDQMERSLAEAHRHQQEHLRAIDLQERVRLAQQEERVRIARDLHDTLLQSMQGLRLLIEAGIEQSRARASKVPTLFDDALVAAIQAINEGRAVLALLRHEEPVFDDLAKSITSAAEELLGVLEIEYAVDVIGAQYSLVPQVWEELYHVSREAIINAARHAKAGRIDVQLSYADGVELCIVDDGIGMDDTVARLGKPGHYGIQGMRERIARIGGEIEILNAPETGTKINVRVPAHSAIYREHAGE